MDNRIIILGAGQAGVQVAIGLRQGGFDGEVLLAGKETHVPYQRPPLSKQILKKEWAAERCQLRHLEFYEQHQIKLLQGVSAQSLDVEKQQISLSDSSSWGYSGLAICTGAVLNRLPVPGAELAGVYYLRDLDEALDLSAQLQPGVRLAVIGAGYIGMEVAASARSLGCEVTVIEAQDEIMKRSAIPAIASYLREFHEQQGVRILLGSGVKQIHGEGRAQSVELANGEMIAVDGVMIGVGVRPDTSWLDNSGVQTNRGVRVDGYCRSNIENIYAAGDVAELEHPLLEGWQVLESVQNAVTQGKLVAANLLGGEQTYTETPWFWSEQYDQRLQMAGIPRAADTLVRREHPETGGFSYFALGGEILHGVQSINAARDYMVGRQLIGKQTPVSAALLADHTSNLKDLL
jgi:3-phenylpropionate/trans-cinnamate dioxygenase ferredoxin reductase subunit